MSLIQIAIHNLSFKMQLHDEPELVSEIIRQKKSYSQNDLLIYKYILQSGDSFLDLGANIGWYSLVASKLVGETGKVYAFEPEDKNFQILKKNKELNDFSQMQIHQLAVSDQQGFALIEKNAQNFGDHQIISASKLANHQNQINTPCTETQTIRLDQFISETDFAKIKLVKIDIQGCEPQALSGMSEHLQKYQPALILEYSPSHIQKRGRSPFEIFSFIENNKYIPFLIVDHPQMGSDFILQALSIEDLFSHTRDLIQKDCGIDLLLIHQTQLQQYQPLLKMKHVPSTEDLSALLLAQKFQFLIDEVDRLDRNIVRPENFYAAQANKAQAFEYLGHGDQANHLFKQIISETKNKIPHMADFASYKRVWHRLAQGEDFQEAMQDLRLGREQQAWGAYSYELKFPRLEPKSEINGKKVLVISEGGQGDHFNHFRFCKNLKDRGAHVTYWQTQASTSSLIERAVICDQYIGPNENPFCETFDFWVGAMDLISALGIHYQDFPLDVYLKADETYLTKWHQKITAATGKKKIGLRWTGEALNDQVQVRSIPFELILDIVKNVDAEFYSLEQTSLPKNSFLNFHDLSQELKNWEDTAAAISCLDLVISSCTAVPHLAATLGVNTFFVVPTLPYYAWAVPGEKSILYKQLSLFRTEKFKGWNEPVFQIIQKLKN